MSKPLSYEALMSFSENEIREVFPLGACKIGKAKWRPALDEEGAERTLKRLLRDKKARMETLRYMRASYSVPGGRIPKNAKAEGPNHNYTENPSRALESVPIVPADWQSRITAEANEEWERYVEEHRPDEVAEQKAKRSVNKLRKLQREATKKGVDLSDVLEDAVRESQSRIVKGKEAA